MSVMTFLQKAGQDILKAVTFGTAIAKDAAPIVSIADPVLGSLINGTASAIISAEAAGASAVTNTPVSDNGSQKAALAISAVEPMAVAFAKSQGLSAPTQAQLQQWINGFVMAFNAFAMPSTEQKSTAAEDAPVRAGSMTQTASTMAG